MQQPQVRTPAGTFEGLVFNGGAGFWGITQATFGIVGALVSFVSMVVVSLLTAAPDKATQDMIDELRIPSGKTILGKQH